MCTAPCILHKGSKAEQDKHTYLLGDLRRRSRLAPAVASLNKYRADFYVPRRFHRLTVARAPRLRTLHCAAGTACPFRVPPYHRGGVAYFFITAVLDIESSASTPTVLNAALVIVFIDGYIGRIRNFLVSLSSSTCALYRYGLYSRVFAHCFGRNRLFSASPTRHTEHCDLSCPKKISELHLVK